MNAGLAALFDLSGRRALVTGGHSGIGGAMARVSCTTPPLPAP